MPALLALTSILLILGLMIGLRWPAAVAGLVGLAATLAVALLGFGYGDGELGPGLAVGGALTEALFVTATILWIIFPALCIYELQLHSGAFEVLKAALSRLSDDPRILAVLVAWFFGLFMEGAAGFGTPILPQIAVTEYSALELARATGLLHGVLLNACRANDLIELRTSAFVEGYHPDGGRAALRNAMYWPDA